VPLDAEIGELEKLIDLHKATVLKRFDDDAKKSIEEFVKAFWRDITRNPPQDLIWSQPSSKHATAPRSVDTCAGFPHSGANRASMRIVR
jgi:hypothetical protein